MTPTTPQKGREKSADGYGRLREVPGAVRGGPFEEAL